MHDPTLPRYGTDLFQVRRADFLRQSCQIKELFLCLNLPLLIETEMTDALQEKNLSGLGGKT